MEDHEVHRRCRASCARLGHFLVARERSTQTACRVAGSPRPNHIKPMPRQQISPEAVDLFSFVQPSPKSRSEPPRPSGDRPSSPPKLASLSDAELARLLKDLIG